MGTKKIIKKPQKQFFFVKKTQPGSRNELVLSINSVMEDILIYHLRLIVVFFEKKIKRKQKC